MIISLPNINNLLYNCSVIIIHTYQHIATIMIYTIITFFDWAFRHIHDWNFLAKQFNCNLFISYHNYIFLKALRD